MKYILQTKYLQKTLVNVSILLNKHILHLPNWSLTYRDHQKTNSVMLHTSKKCFTECLEHPWMAGLLQPLLSPQVRTAVTNTIIMVALEEM